MIELPEEILYQILSHYEPPKRRNEPCEEDESVQLKTLAASCRTCRTFNRLTVPMLYQNLDLEHESEVHLHMLLLTIAHRKHLAEKIEEVTMPAFKPRSLSLDDPIYSTTAATLITAVRGSHLSDRSTRRIVKGLQQKQPDAYLALLLALCPSLRIWHFDISEPIDGSLLMDVVGDANITTDCLTQLKEATAKHSAGGRHITDLTDLAPLLLHPSLESLCIHRAYCDRATKEMPYQVASYKYPAGLRSLELQSSHIDAEGLRTILTSCPSIQALAMHWADVATGVNGFVEWGELGEILRQYGYKLKKLKLDISGMDSTTGRPSSTLPVGNLQKLGHLQELALPADALNGVGDCHFSMDALGVFEPQLPGTLRTLEISTVMSAHRETLPTMIESFTATSNPRSTSLERILIHQQEDLPSFLALIKDNKGHGWNLSATPDGNVLLSRAE